MATSQFVSTFPCWVTGRVPGPLPGAFLPRPRGHRWTSPAISTPSHTFAIEHYDNNAGIGWRPIHGVPRPSPLDSWDRLSADPCDPKLERSRNRKWMDGRIIKVVTLQPPWWQIEWLSGLWEHECAAFSYWATNYQENSNSTNGHAIQIKHCTCKYTGLATYLFIFILYYF